MWCSHVILFTLADTSRSSVCPLGLFVVLQSCYNTRSLPLLDPLSFSVCAEHVTGLAQHHKNYAPWLRFYWFPSSSGNASTRGLPYMPLPRDHIYSWPLLSASGRSAIWFPFIPSHLESSWCRECNSLQTWTQPPTIVSWILRQPSRPEIVS
jgi:hypothetical protein